ncbi:MAG: hypothetical protein POELPBGB_00831 [Bacteroidia bacterium]|nr:hypothetical protein [Bacteroidia bacterium]
MEITFVHKISGADKFQFLLDRHILLNQPTGNFIKLSIEVEGRLDMKLLHRTISANRFLTRLNSIRLEEGFLKIPHWVEVDEQTPITFSELDETTFSSRNGELIQGNALNISVLHVEDDSIVVITMHHALADNISIQTIAKIIDGSIIPEGSAFAEEIKDTTPLIQQLIHTLKATLLVFKKTPKSMAKLVADEVITNTNIIDFDEEETKQIEENAAKNGARLSRSAFYLAAVSMALKQTIFAGKGESFFLPVPQNQRLRGNEQVAMGNHLSFLFYNIPFDKLNTLSEATACITAQMVEQIKNESPKSYSYLLKTFRFLPLWLYDFFFKMPTKGAVCSFLFSDVGETLPDMKTFMGKEIVGVLNFPPNPSPPHLTFVMMKHAGCLKLIMTYNSKAISEEEITKFEAALRALLL